MSYYEKNLIEKLKSNLKEFYFNYGGYGYYIKKSKDGIFLFSYVKRKKDGQEFYDFLQGCNNNKDGKKYIIDFMRNYDGNIYDTITKIK